MSFRKEKKFRLTKYELKSLKNSLICQGMEPLYSKRTINSLYYDTSQLDMFNDSEEGLLPRKKIRIRWYQDSAAASTEIKTSSMEGRFKTSIPCAFISQEELPSNLFDAEYGVLTPSLLVSYEREYFMLNAMRFTFDSDVKYINYRDSRNIAYADGESVMEIKVTADVSDDYIESIFPYATARFSKYCRGLLIYSGQI